MPRIKTLTLAMAAVAMATGCASSQPPLSDYRLKMEGVQSVTHGQDNPQAFYQLGRYYHGQARYDLALESYRQALSLQPQYKEALTGIGVAQATLGQYDEALQMFNAAASLDPASVYAQNNLGYIHWLRNERDEALRAYRQALKLDPLDARTRENLRLALKEAANGPMESATAMEPEPPMQPAERDAPGLALIAVAPQVYELQLPAKKETLVPPLVSAARTLPGTHQPVVSHSNTAAAVAMAGVKPVAATKPVLEQTAPVIYPRRARAQLVTADIPAQQSASAKLPVSSEGDTNIKLEVLNANGMNGLATNVSRYLATRGYPSVSTGNYRHFKETQTRIEYRSVHAELARRLRTLLPGQVSLSQVAGLDGNAKITVVLGNDIRQETNIWSSIGKMNLEASSAGGVRVKTPPLEIANGNGVKGFARKVAHHLSGLGYSTSSVYDMRPFNKAMTRIEYRKGYASQAIKLGGMLPNKVTYVVSGGLRNEMRLVLGHDIKHNMAAWSPWLEGIKLAEATAAAKL